MVYSAAAIARGLWRGSRDRLRLQCPDSRGGVCRRDRAWLRGDGNLRTSRFLIGHRRVNRTGDVLHDSIPVVRPDASLIEALERFRHHDGERLPVVNDSATKRLIGTIAKTDVILALAGRTTRSATMVGSPAS